MKFITSLALLGLAGSISAQAALLVYEPFEYIPDLSDPLLGALNGKDGGAGFAGAWEDMTSGSNAGEGFIYDGTGNTEGSNGAKPDWDGVVDNLPSVGGYVGLSPYANDQLEDRLNARGALEQSAGAMAGADGEVSVPEDTQLDAIARRAYARPLNKRGIERPQRGLQRFCAGMLAKGWVRTGGHSRLLHESLIAHGLATYFDGSMPQPPASSVNEMKRVADRVRTMMGFEK